MLTENFNIRKGFQFKERFERAPFEQRWDEPTYLTFKIEFCFDDVYSRLTSESSFDEIPQGLLILPGEEDLEYDPAASLDMLVKDLDPGDGTGNGAAYEQSLIATDSGYNQKIYQYIGNVSDDKRYSAIEYLLRRNEDYRAWCLARFLQGLTALQNEYQYYFQEIQGLDALSGLTPDRGWQIDKNAVITIKCLEGLDQKVKYLFYLYREAAWDAEYQRWILPDIYRYFKMNIFISEIRTFHQSNFAESGAAADLLTSIATKYVNKWANQFLDKIADWTKGAIDVNVNMDLQRLNIISTAVPITCFRCEMCDFDIARNMYSDSYSINNDKQEESVLKIRVKKCEILNHWKIGGKDGILLKNLKSWLERQYGPDRAHAAYGFIQEGMHDEMWFNGTENLSDDDKSRGYSKVIADGWGVNAARGVLDALSGANGSGILDMAAGIYSTVKNAVAERNATKGEYIESAATNPSDEQESALISLVLTQMYANAMAAPAGTLSQAELEALRIAAHPSERLSDSSVYETIINQVAIIPHTHEPLFQDETIDGSVVQSAMPSFNMAEVEVGRFKDVSLRDVSVYGFADTSVESPDPSMMLADTSFREVSVGVLADTSFRGVPLGDLADTSFREVSVGVLADTSFREVPLGELADTSFREVSVGVLADTSLRDVSVGEFADVSLTGSEPGGFKEVGLTGSEPGGFAEVGLTGSEPGGFADVSLTGSEPGGFMDVSIWSPGVDPILWPLGIPGGDASVEVPTEIGEYDMYGLDEFSGSIDGIGPGSFTGTDAAAGIRETGVGTAGMDDYNPVFADQTLIGTYTDPDIGGYSMTGSEPGGMAEVTVDSAVQPVAYAEAAMLSPAYDPAEIKEQQIRGYEPSHVPVSEAQIAEYPNVQSEVRETLVAGPDYSPSRPTRPDMQAPPVQASPGETGPFRTDYAPELHETGVDSPDPDPKLAEHEVSSPVHAASQAEARVDSPDPDIRKKEARVDSPDHIPSGKETKVVSADYDPVVREARVDSPEYRPELKEARVGSVPYEPVQKEVWVESEDPLGRPRETAVASPSPDPVMKDAVVSSPLYEPRLRPLLVGEDGIPVSGTLVEQEVSSPEPEPELDKSKPEEPEPAAPPAEPRIESAADMFRSNYSPALSRAEIIDKYTRKGDSPVQKETVASPWADQTVKKELYADGTVGGMLDAYSQLKEEGRIGRPGTIDDPEVGSNDPDRPSATSKGRRIRKQIL